MCVHARVRRIIRMLQRMKITGYKGDWVVVSLEWGSGTVSADVTMRHWDQYEG